METTRADFLSRGAKGGLALVAGGSVLAMTNGPAFGSVAADTDIAKLAATAELLGSLLHALDPVPEARGAEAYTWPPRSRTRRTHYKALAGVLGRAAPKNLRFKFPAGTFGSARSIGRTGQALETAFVGAYLGAVKALKSNDLKAVAAHRQQRVAAPGDPVHIAAGTIVSGPSFPKALTAAQATRAVTPFLASDAVRNRDLGAARSAEQKEMLKVKAPSLDRVDPRRLRPCPLGPRRRDARGLTA